MKTASTRRWAGAWRASELISFRGEEAGGQGVWEGGTERSHGWGGGMKRLRALQGLRGVLTIVDACKRFALVWLIA